MKNTGDVSRRLQRVEREIREILGEITIRHFRGDLRGLVTITKVRATSDLKLAKVYYSVLGGPKDFEHNEEFFDERTSEIQFLLARELKTKFCPKLSFFVDDTTENILRVESALRSIEKENVTRNKANE